MPRQPQPTQRLIDIARQCWPFTASDGQVFVRLPWPSAKGAAILPLRSPDWRDWFFYRVYAEHDFVPSTHAFQAILNLLEALASADCERQRLAVFRRVGVRWEGPTPGMLLLDLANPEGQLVEMSPDGWKTTNSSGTHTLFQVSRSTWSIPAPVSSPAESPAPRPLETLRSCLNLSSRADWLRVLAWLLAAFRPFGSCPFLVLQGPPSSGTRALASKTIAASILRCLIDPSTVLLSPIPSTVHDLLNLARHNWILAFDHISTLSPPLVDALCRLSSGIGAAVRETSRPTTQPLLQHYRCPVLLTVTDRWQCPREIAERALTVTFPPLPPASRTSESVLGDTIREAWPAILGDLCSAVTTALRRLPQMDRPSGKRPDALAWALAASPALGCTEEEIERALAPPAPPHPMVEAVRALLEQRRQWTGTATELLELLRPLVPCQTPKGVSQQLKSCMLTLADYGIELKFRHLHGNRRIIDLSEETGGASFPQNAKNAPPDPEPSPQPIETEEVKTS